MKLYSLEEIKKLSKENNNDNLKTNAQYEIEQGCSRDSNYSIEEFDSAKTKILKYVLYKKRSENEVIKKFENIYDKELILEIVENLKENGYIDDKSYIERSINEFIALKNLSIFEIKYKLISKGIKSDEIDDYISNNYDMLIEYEKKSAKNIVKKKISSSDIMEIKKYLMKKGYTSESIKEAIEEQNIN